MEHAQLSNLHAYLGDGDEPCLRLIVRSRSPRTSFGMELPRACHHHTGMKLYHTQTDKRPRQRTTMITCPDIITFFPSVHTSKIQQQGYRKIIQAYKEVKHSAKIRPRVSHDEEVGCAPWVQKVHWESVAGLYQYSRRDWRSSWRERGAKVG